MGRGYHRLYYRDENGVRHAVGTVSDSQYNQMRKNANDAITQRRNSGQGNTPTIKLSGNNKNTTKRMREQVSDTLNRSATTTAERRARQNAINGLSREQIESVAGRLNANQFTLLSPQQQQWYTNATRG